MQTEFVIGDETWCYQYNSTNDETPYKSFTLKNLRISKMTCQNHARLFDDSEETLRKELLQNCPNVSEEHYLRTRYISLRI